METQREIRELQWNDCNGKAPKVGTIIKDYYGDLWKVMGKKGSTISLIEVVGCLLV